MTDPIAEPVAACARPALSPHTRLWGTVRRGNGITVEIAGLTRFARVGDQVRLADGMGRIVPGEVVAIGEEATTAMLMGPADGIVAGQRAVLTRIEDPRPSDAWLGHVIDAFGRLPDGAPAPQGPRRASLRAAPPPASHRRGIGAPLSTGLSVLDTMLPLCRGQRIGVFAGSGVGKSRLLADLARGLDADVSVIGLIGERGREVGEFARTLLGREGLARSVVIAATSDQTALVKRRAALLTMATAEHFRNQGKHVLCLFDSVTRFAEAHREIALAAGETPALRAFPPSTTPAIAGLCERAGPGAAGDAGGDITAVFTVLVAGSDMDEPVADMVRGILDGHVVLDREIAERGRFPAIDLRRSVSRSAPAAWSADETQLALRARQIIATYEEQAPMIQVGLYTPGADARLDEAVRLWPALDGFVGAPSPALGAGGRAASFARLASILAAEAPAPAAARAAPRQTAVPRSSR